MSFNKMRRMLRIDKLLFDRNFRISHNIVSAVMMLISQDRYIIAMFSAFRYYATDRLIAFLFQFYYSS